MEDQRVLERVQGSVADELSVDPSIVKPQARFVEDLGADSLDVVELVMRFEEEFDIEIPDEDAEKMTTVSEAAALIERQLTVTSEAQAHEAQQTDGA